MLFFVKLTNATMPNMISKFIFDQLKQISRGGVPVFLKKLGIILIIPVVLLTVFMVRLLKPFKIIKFGRLINSRIGHFMMDIEIYLCEKEAGLHDKRSRDVFYYGSDKFCNYQLKKMCERSVWVVSFAKYIDKVNRIFPGAQEHIVPFDLTRDIYGVVERTAGHFFLTPDEERFGEKELGRIGVSPDKPLVCFHARDSAYLEAMLPENSNWAYHNYRDSGVYNYLPAAEELVSRGYYVIRMGNVVREALPGNPRIIDYATKYRTDFLDVYLGARCKFFICDTAGIYAIPAMFRKPIAWVNFIPFEYIHAWNKNYLIITKKLWLKTQRRFLTFREILGSQIGQFCESREYEQSGIEVIENTSEEIAALAVEMDQRLKGEWQENAADEELQKRFRDLFKSSQLNKVFVSRLGAEFLRQNKELLV